MKRMLPLLVAALLLCAWTIGPVATGAATTVSMTFAGVWGSLGLGEGEFSYPTDVAADKWGNVYVAGGANGDHRVQMFSGEGEYLASVGTTGIGSAVLDEPRSVTTDRWGNVWVAELENTGRITRFHPGLYGGMVADS